MTARVRRLVPRGLRSQLALAIAIVTVAGVGASFLALLSGVGSGIQGQIDASLRTQRAEWRQFIGKRDVGTPAGLTAAARAFIAAQSYHAEALVIVIQVSGGTTVSNADEVLTHEIDREAGAGEHGNLLTAGTGLTNAVVAEAGSVRVLSAPITSGARRVGTLRVATSLSPIEHARASLRHTFLFVGLLTLALATALGLWLAGVIAAPLRRIAGVARSVEAGDLSIRAGDDRGSGEVAVLAEAFDHMLDRLERSFKRQRDFVSDASHELRTPLSVLRAQVELLDGEPDPEQRHEGTATLLRRLDELDRLVGDMLTLASAEDGQLVHPHPIALAPFFEDLRRDLPLYGERDFSLQPVGGTLVADTDRLTQVLRNLIRNAVNHTGPSDSVAIVARARGGSLELTVSDTGPGIPADELHAIFERFHRVDRGRSRDTGGSGLGLAIARAIVEAHGGTISAESAPGAGATFRITLPGYAPG